MKIPMMNWFRLQVGVTLLFLCSTGLMAQRPLFETSNSRAESLNSRQTEVFNRAWNPREFSEYQFIEIAELSAAVSERSIVLNAGNGCGSVRMVAKNLEVENAGNYYLYAEYENFATKSDCKTGNLMLRRKNGAAFGVLRLGKDAYLIEDLGEGKNVLLRYHDREEQDHDHGVVSACDPIRVPGSRPGTDQGGEGGNRINCDIRVLFLFTNSTAGALANIDNHAQAHIDQINQALGNSGVSSSQLRFELANAAVLNSVDETNENMFDVLSAVRLDATAQNLRNQNDADLVCLVADNNIANFGNTIGLAYGGFNGAPTTDVFGYSVIQLTQNLANYLFVHEGGHNVGAGHEPEQNQSTNVDKAFRFSWTTGWWIFQQNHTRRTVMWSSPSSVETIPHYSNPNVDFARQATGTTTRNNAQILRNNACTVAAFRGASNNLQASISGPSEACQMSTRCFGVNISGAPGPYTYQWAWTLNGTTYNSLGNSTTACLSMFSFNVPELITIRLIVTGGGQTVTTYHDVNVVNATNNGQIPCAQKVAAIPVDQLEGAENTLNLVPNPAGFRMDASLYLREKADVQIGVYSLSGQLVKAIQQTPLEKGQHKIAVDVSELPAGVYLLKVSSEKMNLVKRLMVAR